MGIIYTRIQRSGPRGSTIVFSENAILRHIRGVPYFMFQVALLSPFVPSHACPTSTLLDLGGRAEETPGAQTYFCARSVLEILVYLNFSVSWWKHTSVAMLSGTCGEGERWIHFFLLVTHLPLSACRSGKRVLFQQHAMRLQVLSPSRLLPMYARSFVVYI